MVFTYICIDFFHREYTKKTVTYCATGEEKTKCVAPLYINRDIESQKESIVDFSVTHSSFSKNQKRKESLIYSLISHDIE